MVILGAGEVERLVDMRACIEAVEAAFRARGSGLIAHSAVTGVPLPGGKLHAKLASVDLGRHYAVAKVNANLPGNPASRSLPAIQGIVLLFDAATGVPLAAMDSGAITSMRTAAASAVAARWLALPDASSLAVIGCGVQARAHVAAMLCVKQITTLRAYDSSPTLAKAFCEEMSTRYRLHCRLAEDVRSAAAPSEIVVTMTPSQQPILDIGDVSPGTFVAAVGADSEDKQEISVDLLRSAAIVVDDLDQCARIGDLHHALEAKALTTSEVRGSLDQLVAGRARGRVNESEIIVFDSTGVAIEDAAAAALVYEKALAAEVGVRADAGRLPLQPAG